jgi:hypothetical protein
MSDRSGASDGKTGHVRNSAVIAAPIRAATVKRAYRRSKVARPPRGWADCSPDSSSKARFFSPRGRGRMTAFGYFLPG